MVDKNAENRDNKKSLENVLKDALETTRSLEFKGEQKEAVVLALQTLLIVRGGLHPGLFSGAKKFNPYPTLVKYVRASNSETLGALVDDVLRAVSPNFVTLHSLGTLTESIYEAEDELKRSALALLQEETTPLVIMMKKIYQDARGFDEADTTTSTEEGADA